jgi:hypothetical protein
MSKFLDYSQVVTPDQLDGALRAASCDAVAHYLSGDFALRIEDPAVVSAIRARGWHQCGISVPTLGGVNGAADAATARDVYGFGAGFQLALDIEPDEFRGNPGAWGAAADAWCDQVRAAGLSPGVYGTDDTVAACGNHADWIWRAKPGQCDPAGPGLDPAFFAGQRAAQCITTTVAGVSVDVDFSQFPIGAQPTPPPPPPPAPIPQEEDDMGDIAYLDAHLELGQQHVLYTDAKGQLIQLYYDETGGDWTSIVVATGLASRAPVTAKVVDNLRQVQLVARLADGRILHAWAPFGAGWTVESRGNPDGA